MRAFNLTSDYGHVHFGSLYVGWNNHNRYVASEMDCGDESFGFALGRFYTGCYADGKWCIGFLNEYGCLN